MRIQTNTSANSALGYMRANSMATERSIQKLSSGFRINRSGDDAAGLALANKLRADGRSLAQAQKNTAQGTAMLQIMDGATQTVSTILDRMKELATQSNSANVGDQRDKLQAEFVKLTDEIDRIVGTTKYQGSSLINGSMGNTVSTTSTALSTASMGVHRVNGGGSAPAGTYTLSAPGTAAGANKLTLTDANGVSQTVDVTSGGRQTVNFSNFGISIETAANFTTATSSTAGSANAGTIIVAAGTGSSFMVSSSGDYTGNDRVGVGNIDLSTGSTGLNITGDLTTQDNAAAMLATLDTAISAVSTALGTIGSAQSRMDFAAANVATTLQNTQAAESTIRDADMAYEMTQFTKNNILQQAAQSMLSQANQGTQNILQLLRG